MSEALPHTYTSVLRELCRRLEEPAPSHVQLLTGPRQVGKTHLLHRVEEQFEGRTLYAAADTPEASLPGWWEQIWREGERLARAGRSAVLLLDEIQYLPQWSRRLKAEYDRVVHRSIGLHVVVCGSSSLSVGRGARESMAGRFERLRLLHWPASELVRHFDLDEDRALDVAVRSGTYPGAIRHLGEPDRWRQYVRDAIVEPALGRDLLAIETVRKPGLLRQVFAVAAGHPAEIISLQKLRGQLSDGGALETVAHYLHLLEEAYLVAPLPKFTAKAVRRRAAPPKLVVLSQAILAALATGDTLDRDPDPTVWGRWVENACIAHAWNAGQEVSYWREQPIEVDMVLSGSWGKWIVEVKTGSFGMRDLAGLLELARRHREYRPLLLCDEEDQDLGSRAGIACSPWRRFLLSGPPSA